MIPSIQTCYRLIQEMTMLPHIVSHSEQVCRVALCMVDHMNHSTTGLNRPLIQAAALLHDITKTRSFETGENHAATGRELLMERGYAEVASVVGQHVHLDNDEQYAGIGEAQIVNYADKRVLHDEIVSLERRMAYIVERYGQEEVHRVRIMQLWEESRRLESLLFEHIGFQPDELPRYVSKK